LEGGEGEAGFPATRDYTASRYMVDLGMELDF
jgi:hypothetical protein